MAYAKSNCQIKGDYNWQLGFGSNILSDPLATSIEFQFDSSHLEIDTFFRTMTMGDLNTSFSDDNGNLMLYTNGCQIRDGNHQYIENTNNLSPGDVNNEWCLQEKIGYPVFDGGLFLPITVKLSSTEPSAGCGCTRSTASRISPWSVNLTALPTRLLST